MSCYPDGMTPADLDEAMGELPDIDDRDFEQLLEERRDFEEVR